MVWESITDIVQQLLIAVILLSIATERILSCEELSIALSLQQRLPAHCQNHALQTTLVDEGLPLDNMKGHQVHY